MHIKAIIIKKYQLNHLYQRENHSNKKLIAANIKFSPNDYLINSNTQDDHIEELDESPGHSSSSPSGSG